MQKFIIYEKQSKLLNELKNKNYIFLVKKQFSFDMENTYIFI